MESLNAADPRIATGLVINTAIYSVYAHYISHGLPAHLHHALTMLRSNIAQKTEFPVLATHLRINYEFSFGNLSLVPLADASFMACAKRICSEPISKMLLLSFVSSIQPDVSNIVLASSLVHNIPWTLTFPLNYLANVFQICSGFKQASETKIARFLYACASLVFFTLDRKNYIDVLPFGETRASLAPGMHITDMDPYVRESMRSLLWSLSCIYAYYLLQQVRNSSDPAQQQDLIATAFTDLSDMLYDLVSPKDWVLPTSLLTIPFAYLTEKDAMRITNDVLMQRAFVMRTIDEEENQILADINAWQATEDAIQAENAMMQDRPLVIADTGQKIRRHGSQMSGTYEMHVPLFPLKKFQEAKDSDETYTTDSYSLGITFSDVDIIQRHMGPDFCIPLRITFYGLLASLVDDATELVRRMAIHVCNLILKTVLQRFATVPDVLCIDDILLTPIAQAQTQAQTHPIMFYPKVFTLAPCHILREILYINQASLSDPSLTVSYLMRTMRFFSADLTRQDILDDIDSNIKANCSLNLDNLSKRSTTFMFCDNVFQKLMLQTLYIAEVDKEIIDTLFLSYLPRVAVFSRPGSHDSMGEIKFFQSILRDKKTISNIADLVWRDFARGIDEIMKILYVLDSFFTNSRETLLSDELMSYMRHSCYLGAFLCGARPFLCEFYNSPLLYGNEQAILETFELTSLDTEAVQAVLRERLHTAIMQELGKGELCNELRTAFLWGFLTTMKYSPPSILFSCAHPCAPAMEDLRSFT